MKTTWEENQVELTTVEKARYLNTLERQYSKMLIFIVIIFAILLIFTLQFIARRNLAEITTWNGTPNNFCSLKDGRLTLIGK